MLDQLGREAGRVPDTVIAVTRATARRAGRLGYLALIGRKNPLSSMRTRQ